VNPLTDCRWTEFVESHPRASIFHTTQWLDALRRTYGYEPIVYTTSRPGNVLQNGLPCCRVASWLTGRRLVSLPFSDHCEPLVDSTENAQAMFQSVRKLVATEHWKYLEFRPLACPDYAFALTDARPSARYYIHEIDLTPGEDEIFRQFHKTSVQQRIHRAEREGVTHECGRSDSHLAKFFRLQLLIRQYHRVPPQPWQWFQNLAECMGDALKVHVASYQKKEVAAVLILHFKNTIVYKYGASDPKYNRLGLIPFLLWKAIQTAKASGVETFDLGRSEYWNKGLIDFKDHFTSERRLLTYWRCPGPVRGCSQNESYDSRFAKQCFHALPNVAQRKVGQLLYRHIG
jgi:hypothetical protein